MIYLGSFLYCGIICMISQIILDNTKLTPGHVTSFPRYPLMSEIKQMYLNAYYGKHTEV